LAQQAIAASDSRYEAPISSPPNVGEQTPEEPHLAEGLSAGKLLGHSLRRQGAASNALTCHTLSS